MIFEIIHLPDDMEVAVDLPIEVRFMGSAARSVLRLLCEYVMGSHPPRFPVPAAIRDHELRPAVSLDRQNVGGLVEGGPLRFESPFRSGPLID